MYLNVIYGKKIRTKLDKALFCYLVIKLISFYIILDNTSFFRDRMTSMFESQRNFGPAPMFSKSVRNPISPPTMKSDNPTLKPALPFKSEKPEKSDLRDDLKWMAAAQVIGAARAQMMQQQHQVFAASSFWKDIIQVQEQ